MTMESNGVIVDQAVVEDARAAAAREQALGDTPVTEPEVDGTLALEALKVAAYTNDTPDATTARARIYLDWLKENG
jgi:hypothetical protein